ncbi:hypothetical protein L218DRAFT_124653 [Marasmius fiardii PR-910]|nr:hypothetical protein L218DRAFT_124653 [Marasmius fiardii PR-910]
MIPRGRLGPSYLFVCLLACCFVIWSHLKFLFYPMNIGLVQLHWSDESWRSILKMISTRHSWSRLQSESSTRLGEVNTIIAGIDLKGDCGTTLVLNRNLNWVIESVRESPGSKHPLIHFYPFSQERRKMLASFVD